MPKKKVKSLPTTTELYKDFLLGLQFLGLGLDSSSASVDRVILADDRSAGHAIETGFGAEYKVLTQKSDRFVIGASYSITQKKKDATEPLVAINASFSALFESASTLDPAHIERFSQNEARMIFWPYLRFYISDISARMSISQILLPLTFEFKA
jgi:hypothetical protein